MRSNIIINEAEIQSVHDQLGHCLGWRLLTCPKRNIDEASTALITTNPGGMVFEPPIASVETGSAYVEENWKRYSPGDEPLQRQVRRMFDMMDVLPERVLSGYLVPFRSREWADLRAKKESLAFGIGLWRKILSQSMVTTIIAFGKDAGYRVATILDADQLDRVFAGWGDQTIDRYTFRKDGRLLVLPHLSRYALFGRSPSEDCFRAALRACS
jgi:hypothetical protein